MEKEKTKETKETKEGLYVLRDYTHGLEVCGETPEQCAKNLEIGLKAFELFDKFKEKP